MTKARASSPGRPLSLTTTRIRLAADRQSECRSPALPSSPDVTQRTFENRRSVCLGERAPGWLRPRITGYSAGPLPLAGVRRHRLSPRLSRAGCCLSRASAAGTEALQMTCRLALRSASAGVSGMSRMTPPRFSPGGSCGTPWRMWPLGLLSMSEVTCTNGRTPVHAECSVRAALALGPLVRRLPPAAMCDIAAARVHSCRSGG